MQDPRVRLFSVALLSVVAFTSVQGAFLVLLWLIIFAPLVQVFRNGVRFIPLFAGVVVVAVFACFLGDNGVGYGIRLGVVTLIGCCAWVMTRPLDALSVSVWLFGDTVGFDLGMAASLALTGILVFGGDFERGLSAVRFKSRRPGVRQVASLIFILVIRAVGRMEDQARVLATRGYTRGGTFCPRFSPGLMDVFAVITGLEVAILSILPVRDIFILMM